MLMKLPEIKFNPGYAANINCSKSTVETLGKGLKYNQMTI